MLMARTLPKRWVQGPQPIFGAVVLNVILDYLASQVCDAALPATMRLNPIICAAKRIGNILRPK
jgi:hypothetical protein